MSASDEGDLFLTTTSNRSRTFIPVSTPLTTITTTTTTTTTTLDCPLTPFEEMSEASFPEWFYVGARAEVYWKERKVSWRN